MIPIKLEQKRNQASAEIGLIERIMQAIMSMPDSHGFISFPKHGSSKGGNARRNRIAKWRRINEIAAKSRRRNRGR